MKMFTALELKHSGFETKFQKRNLLVTGQRASQHGDSDEHMRRVQRTSTPTTFRKTLTNVGRVDIQCSVRPRQYEVFVCRL
ncbi:hypothetical protein F2P81_010342 [Scophthalmus maximus]|uniref:Uncharacterized protein n=1 Tax=Scophthalmus maximus TaxID=52904 RepID=A0A6A4SZK5_SCOMX|nr:hypothetical protein F2P81_010342 [Scophthalmus maximus]